MALTYGENVKYEGAKPFDDRLLKDTLDELQSRPSASLYPGMLATYRGDNDHRETWQWFPQGGWQKVHFGDVAELFKVCSSEYWTSIQTTGPASEDLKRIHLKQSATQTSATTGLYVWEQKLWDSETNQWKSLGNIELNFDASKYATKNDLANKVDYSEYNTRCGQIETDLATHCNKVGSWEDFMSGYNEAVQEGYGNPVDFTITIVESTAGSDSDDDADTPAAQG